MNFPKVSVVVLNYNTKKLLSDFLPFLIKTDYPNLEIVVADNASNDGSAQFVLENYPSIKVIEMKENLGFAGGYNAALKQVNSPYYVLLNSDVEVPSNWLSNMMNLMLSQPDIAAIQPKIKDLNNRDSFEYAGAAGGFLDKYAYPFCRGRMFDNLEIDSGQYDTDKQVFWATGAALLVKSDIYHELGGLDEDFFAHMEEIDLCWRIKNAGYEVWVSGASHVYHLGGGTLDAQSSRKTFLNFRNNLILITKNAKTSEAVKMLFARLFLDGIAGTKFVLSGKLGSMLAIVKAHWTFFARFRYYWNKRKLVPIQKPLAQHVGYFDDSIVKQYFLKGVTKFDALKKPPVQ